MVSAFHRKADLAICRRHLQIEFCIFDSSSEPNPPPPIPSIIFQAKSASTQRVGMRGRLMHLQVSRVALRLCCLLADSPPRPVVPPLSVLTLIRRRNIGCCWQDSCSHSQNVLRSGCSVNTTGALFKHQTRMRFSEFQFICIPRL